MRSRQPASSRPVSALFERSWKNVSCVGQHQGTKGAVVMARKESELNGEAVSPKAKAEVDLMVSRACPFVALS
jgi:hypothetical protein